MSSKIIIGTKTPDKKSGVLVKIDLNSLLIIPFFNGEPIKENIIQLDINNRIITNTEIFPILNNRIVNEKQNECAIGDGIRNAVRDSHVDIRRDLYNNILLMGDNKISKDEEFAKGLNGELRKIIPKSVDIRIHLIDEFEPIINWKIK